MTEKIIENDIYEWLETCWHYDIIDGTSEQQEADRRGIRNLSKDLAAIIAGADLDVLTAIVEGYLEEDERCL